MKNKELSMILKNRERSIKRAFRCLLLLSSLFCLAACVQDEKELFDRSATERTNALINEYTSLLESAEYGWKMEYYPETDRSAGGYIFLCSFDKGEATMMGDFSLSMNGQDVYPAGTQVTSLYRLIAEQGPVLTFDTYNILFHFFSEPKGTADTDGYAGDYEFVVMEQQDDRLVLKGKKHGNTLLMTRLKQSQQETMEQILETQIILNNTPYDRIEIGGREYVLNLNLGSRQFVVTDGEGPDASSWQSAFVYTESGFKLYDPLEIGGEQLKEFHLDKAERTLSGVGVQANVLRTPWIRILTNPTTQYFIDFNVEEDRASMNAELFELLKEGYRKNTGEKFIGLYIGQNHRGSEPASTVVCFMSQSGSYYYYPSYACEFRADENDNLEFVPDYAKNSMASWYPWCRPIVEYLADHSPYKLEMPPTGSDNALRLVSTKEEGVWFEIYY